MPQGPFNLVQQPIQGTKSKLNVTAATVIDTGPGRVAVVVMTTVSAGKLAVYDSASTSGNGITNQIFGGAATTPAGTYVLDFPYTNGLVVDPGSTGVAAVYYI